jgi:tight adherence protein C
MSQLIIPVATVVLMALACALALWWDKSHTRRASRRLTARRRAVTATLQAATVRLPAPNLATGPSQSDTFFDRVINPVAAGIARLGRSLSPPGYVDSVKRRLTIAGNDTQVGLDRFLAGRLATVALVPVAFILVELASIPKFYRLLAFLLVTIVLLLGPEASLSRRAEDRQERIRRDLPALVDLLLISVEAGLGFDQALTRAVISLPGPLSEEFARFLGEVRMGGERTESLEDIDERTDVAELRSFLMALIQAERFGVSIGSILRSQAGDIRVSQRQHIQELAQKAPVKMLFPLVFCVLPALFIVVIGPAGIQLYDEIQKGVL